MPQIGADPVCLVDEMARTAHRRGADAGDRIAEAIASKVIEIVRRELGAAARDEPEEWIDAAEVARRSGFSRAWVYANAGRLGAAPVGDGVRPRLRFDARILSEFLRARAERQTVRSKPAQPGRSQVHVPRIRPMVPKRKAQ